MFNTLRMRLISIDVLIVKSTQTDSRRKGKTGFGKSDATHISHMSTKETLFVVTSMENS